MSEYILPREIRIGPFDYRVLRAGLVDSNQRWGESDHNLREIRFGTLTHERQMAVTFMHEVMHAVWQVYGLRDVDAPEEQVVTALATGCAQVFQDIGLWPKEMML